MLEAVLEAAMGDPVVSAVVRREAGRGLVAVAVAVAVVVGGALVLAVPWAWEREEDGE
jgi:hypothetical protein